MDRIYNVTIPSVLAWPPGRVTLTTVFLKEDAERYIATYPNLFLRPLMEIEEKNVTIRDTD